MEDKPDDSMEARIKSEAKVAARLKKQRPSTFTPRSPSVASQAQNIFQGAQKGMQSAFQAAQYGDSSLAFFAGASGAFGGPSAQEIENQFVKHEMAAEQQALMQANIMDVAPDEVEKASVAFGADLSNLTVGQFASLQPVFARALKQKNTEDIVAIDKPLAKEHAEALAPSFFKDKPSQDAFVNAVVTLGYNGEQAQKLAKESSGKLTGASRENRIDQAQFATKDNATALLKAGRKYMNPGEISNLEAVEAGTLQMGSGSFKSMVNSFAQRRAVSEARAMPAAEARATLGRMKLSGLDAAPENAELIKTLEATGRGESTGATSAGVEKILASEERMIKDKPTEELLAFTIEQIEAKGFKLSETAKNAILKSKDKSQIDAIRKNFDDLVPPATLNLIAERDAGMKKALEDGTLGNVTQGSLRGLIMGRRVNVSVQEAAGGRFLMKFDRGGEQIGKPVFLGTSNTMEAKARAKIGEVKSALAALDKLEEVGRQLITVDKPESILDVTGLAKVWLAGKKIQIDTAFGTDERAVAFARTQTAFLNIIVRATGDRGALTQGDKAEISKAMATIYDNTSTFDIGINAIRDILHRSSMVTAKEMVTGEAVSELKQFKGILEGAHGSLGELDEGEDVVGESDDEAEAASILEGF